MTAGAPFPTSPRPLPPRGRRSARPAPKRRHKFYRPHKVHYYLVLTGISLAVLVCGLNTVAYLTRRVDLANATFAAVLVTALVIFVAFFMGFYMVAAGNIPVSRLKYLLPHAAAGMLSPLVYTLNIAASLDSIGEGPVSRFSVIASFVCLGLLLVQFAMGKAIVRPDPLRLISPNGVRKI